jgi:diacylglycerol kinase family enzyme
MEAPPIRRIAVVVTPLSGSTKANSLDEVKAIVEAAGVEAECVAASGDALVPALKAAVDSAPDLLVIVAGDGTARAAAELAGPKGVLIAPLPGGTMNMLPRALYGTRDWHSALKEILEDGVVCEVSGGEVNGSTFFVAAILGAPALWAEAREAARELKPLTAFRRARRALSMAFTGRLRFIFDGKLPDRAEALILLCPLISPELDADDLALEAVALDPTDASEAFRLAFHAVTDGWRRDPAVNNMKIRRGRVWASGHIPAVLDGEPRRLPRRVEVRFKPRAFKALRPREIVSAKAAEAAGA